MKKPKVTWDDFQEQLDRVNRNIDKMTEALKRMKVAFESLSKTYEEMIDYADTLPTRFARMG